MQNKRCHLMFELFIFLSVGPCFDMWMLLLLFFVYIVWQNRYKYKNNVELKLVLVDVFVITNLAFFFIYFVCSISLVNSFEMKIELNFHITTLQSSVKFYNPFEHCRLYKWFHGVFSSFFLFTHAYTYKCLWDHS